ALGHEVVDAAPADQRPSEPEEHHELGGPPAPMRTPRDGAPQEDGLDRGSEHSMHDQAAGARTHGRRSYRYRRRPRLGGQANAGEGAKGDVSPEPGAGHGGDGVERYLQAQELDRVHDLRVAEHPSDRRGQASEGESPERAER